MSKRTAGIDASQFAISLGLLGDEDGGGFSSGELCENAIRAELERRNIKWEEWIEESGKQRGHTFFRVSHCDNSFCGRAALRPAGQLARHRS